MPELPNENFETQNVEGIVSELKTAFSEIKQKSKKITEEPVEEHHRDEYSRIAVDSYAELETSDLEDNFLEKWREDVPQELKPVVLESLRQEGEQEMVNLIETFSK